MNPLHPFLAWIRAKRLTRMAERLERERLALMRARDYRKSKHMAFRPTEGELRRVTTQALAAEIGRWPKGVA